MHGGRFLGPPVYTATNQRHVALETFRSANPDRGGSLSTILMIGLVSLLLGAAFTLGLLWVNMPGNIRSNRDYLEHGRLRKQVFQVMVDGTEIPECNCSAVEDHDFAAGFSDTDFAVFNADDGDKILEFDVSSMLTGPQTITLQSGDGIAAYLGDIPMYPTAFSDAEFAIFNSGQPNKRMLFDLSGIGMNTVIELAIQNAGGTIACLTDVPAMSAVFEDDVFAIQHAADQSREVQFDVPELGSGGATIALAVQDADGTIALESDLWQNRDEFSDAEFLIHAAGNVNTLLRLDLSLVSDGATRSLKVQDASGTVAYRDDLPRLNIARITEARSFPDMANEGFTTLSAMNVERVVISMCGGGGSGSAIIVDADGTEEYNGGGAGGGFYQFAIDDVASLYERFDITTIGAGGISATTATACTSDTRGGTTSLLGIPVSGPLHTSTLLLSGFGGGCTTELNTNQGFYGGCGAGNGLTGTVQPGFEGDLGGVKGACGRIPEETPQTGPLRAPWFGGAHGGSTSLSDGSTSCTSAGKCPSSGALFIGGDGGLGRAGGGGGLFGNGGNSDHEFPGEANAPPFSCAGGGSPEASTEVSAGTFVGWSRGGAGQVMIEYWFTPPSP